jgi:RNA methyltransferase, TrmH family
MISKSQAKYIQSLGHKKQRDQEGVFIAEGPKVVKELLMSKNAEVKNLYALDGWLQENEKLLAHVDAAAIDERELEKISQLTTPNRVVAIVKKFSHRESLVKGKITIVLDAIQDPGNFGTIVRTADWFGVQQIFCSHDCADLYNAKVVQATMGSIARVSTFYTDLIEWLQAQKAIGIYASMLDGKDVTKMPPLKEGLIVIGNEAKGIRQELLAIANERITIPRKGEAESLNAAIAAGIILACLVS